MTAYQIKAPVKPPRSLWLIKPLIYMQSTVVVLIRLRKKLSKSETGSKIEDKNQVLEDTNISTR